MVEIYSKYTGCIYGTFIGHGLAESFLMTMTDPWHYAIRPRTKGVFVNPQTGERSES